MNKFFKQIAYFTFLLVVIASCDVVDNPLNPDYLPPPPAGDEDRVIVIEDYTGHRCKNCPKAAKALKDIEDAYGDRIIGIAVHAGAGNFTNPSPPDYPTNFKTPEGTAMANFFGISFLPVGMVSRADWTPTGSVHRQPYAQWSSSTAALLASDSTAKLSIDASVVYNAGTRNADITVEFEPLVEMAFDLKYMVIITEDNIVAPQLMPDDTRDTNYVHHHVLRTTYTQALGDDLAMSPIIPDTIFTKTVSGSIDPEWVEDECEVVVYVFNADNYEILQATKVALKP